MTPPSVRCRPGDLTPISGVYRVVHGTGHRAAHDALAIRGEEFPACRSCGSAVAYEILRAVSHMSHDWDFTGPTSLTIQPRGNEFAKLRAFAREEACLPVVVRSPDGGAELHGVTVDVSDGGVGVILNQSAPTLAGKVAICIAAPGMHKSLVFRGRLRHGVGKRFGFQFVRPGVRRQAELRRSLSAHAGG